MTSLRTLTGITPSGTPHIGNYVGAIKPSVASQTGNSLYFIADYHSLVKLQDRKVRQQYIYEIAASSLALGLDPAKTIFYRQSGVPEITELAWILSTLVGKGLLNRAHAYKDVVAKNVQENLDPDMGISMGLFCYPVLMAADILAFNAHKVPVGKDQIQHVEIARDIALRFNHVYGEVFVLPEAQVDEQSHTLPGLDGRKMSKSYGNTIQLFSSSKQLRKSVMQIVTNSQLPEEPKDPNGCNVFQIYRAFATPAQTAALAQRYEAGIGWGQAKQQLFELLDALLTEPRKTYDALMADTKQIDVILVQGAERARAVMQPILTQVRHAVGL
jgi:tryptophanyl-tRNA synthetase